MNTKSYMLFFFLFLNFCATSLNAQISCDGTLGPVGPLNGPNYEISSDLGQQRGSNLFHSFNTFNLDASETANFTGPSSVQNIINRVTGGTPSQINGTISSQIKYANLYFLNPAGVMFGPNASLDISGSLYISTADYLRLGNGGRFEALQPGNSILTSAPVEAFGFLNNDVADISFQETQVHVRDKSSISIIGGDLYFQGSSLYVPSNNINIASIASVGEIHINDNKLTLSSEYNLADISFSNGSNIIVTSNIFESNDNNSVAIHIHGNNISIEDSEIISTNGETRGDGGNIVIIAKGLLHILNNGKLKSTAYYDGDAGDISIKAENIQVQEFAELSTSIDEIAVGNSGNINIETNGSIELIDGGQINSSNYGNGSAGDIFINAGSILIDARSNERYTGFSAQAGNYGIRGGDISISTIDSLDILNGGKISTLTSSYYSGDSGDIFIESGNMLIDGNGIDSGIFSQVTDRAIGNGGKIDLLIKRSLNLKNRGVIDSSTQGEGNAGNININSSDISMVSAGMNARTGINGRGNAGNIQINTQGSLNLSGSQIDSSNDGIGNAGNIFTNAGSITIDGQGNETSTGFVAKAGEYAFGSGGNITISTIESLNILNGGVITTSTSSTGDSGSILVDAKNILVDGNGVICGFNTQSSENSIGNAGAIILGVIDSLNLINGGVINTATYGEGSAGDIIINTQDISIDNQCDTSTTGVSAITNGWGWGKEGASKGGHVLINAIGSLELLNGATINTSTYSDGNAGDITINAGDILINGNGIDTGFYTGVIFNALGNGGNINIKAAGKTEITNSGKLLSTSDSSGSYVSSGIAGNIKLESPKIFLTNASEISTETTAVDGGNITIAADDILSLFQSKISTSVSDFLGNGGNITIDPIFVILDSSNITANAHDGIGGNIDLTTNYFFPDSFSVIEASSRFGINGTINIDTPNIDLSSSLVTLPGYRKHSELSTDSCESKEGSSTSSLVKTGQGSIAPDPEISLSAFYIFPLLPSTQKTIGF